MFPLVRVSMEATTQAKVAAWGFIRQNFRQPKWLEVKERKLRRATVKAGPAPRSVYKLL